MPDPEGDALLRALDTADLVFRSNLPYARHGYLFQRTALRAAFGREVTGPADEDGPSHRRFRFGATNPFYNDVKYSNRSIGVSSRSFGRRKNGASAATPKPGRT